MKSVRNLLFAMIHSEGKVIKKWIAISRDKNRMPTIDDVTPNFDLIFLCRWIMWNWTPKLILISFFSSFILRPMAFAVHSLTEKITQWTAGFVLLSLLYLTRLDISVELNYANERWTTNWNWKHPNPHENNEKRTQSNSNQLQQQPQQISPRLAFVFVVLYKRRTRTYKRNAIIDSNKSKNSRRWQRLHDGVHDDDDDDYDDVDEGDGNFRRQINVPLNTYETMEVELVVVSHVFHVRYAHASHHNAHRQNTPDNNTQNENGRNRKSRRENKKHTETFDGMRNAAIHSCVTRGILSIHARRDVCECVARTSFIT